MKRIIALIFVLAALIVMYFIIQGREESESSGSRVENFLGMDTTRVSKIVLSRFGSEISLSRVGDVWYVLGEESRRAEDGAMRQLLASLSALTVGSVISDNPANQMKFQVDSLTGSTVRVFESGELASSLVIGIAAPNFGSTYVRRPGSNDVYLAEGMLSHLFNRPPNSWLDKTVSTLPRDGVTGVDVVLEGESFSLALSDTIWSISKAGSEGTEPVSNLQIGTYLDRLCGLKADDFAAKADTSEYSFDEAFVEVSLHSSDGSVLVVEGAAPKEDAHMYYIRLKDDSTVFVVYSPTWDILTRSYAEFVAEEKNI